MRIVVGISSDDQTFSLLRVAAQLYPQAAFTLVHAIDHGLTRYPTLGTKARDKVHEEMSPLLDAGHTLLEKAAKSIPADLNITPETACSLGNPSRLIIKAAEEKAADLIIIGSREHQHEEREFTLGSTSHQTASHAPCATLTIKNTQITQIRRALIAVKSPDDSAQIYRWLASNPFHSPVEVTILHVVPALHSYLANHALAQYDQWHDFLHNDSMGSGQDFVDNVSAMFTKPPASNHYKAHGQIANGDPADIIIKEAAQYDLVIVGSSGALSAIRFLYGSVVQKVIHRISIPIMITG